MEKLFLVVSRGQTPDRATPVLASSDSTAIRRAVGELLNHGGIEVRSAAAQTRRQKESGRK